jgi:hypothetical protein
MKSAKVTVLADQKGTIVAVASEPSGPEHLLYQAGDTLTASPGQTVHEVAVPKEIAAGDVHALHSEIFKYRVEKRKGQVRLLRK